MPHPAIMERMETPVTVVILAAGLGTRMKSHKAKVLHRAGGKTLVEHAVDRALALTSAERVFVVVGHQAERVRAAVTTPGIGFIEQTEQLGTGHARLVGRDALSHLDGNLVIFYGDGPWLLAATDHRRRRSPGCHRDAKAHRAPPAARGLCRAVRSAQIGRASCRERV